MFDTYNKTVKALRRSTRIDIGLRYWPPAIMRGSPMRKIRSHDPHVDTIVINTNSIVPIRSRIAWINPSPGSVGHAINGAPFWKKLALFRGEKQNAKRCNLSYHCCLSLSATTASSRNGGVGGRREQGNVCEENIRISLLLSVGKHMGERGSGPRLGKKGNSFPHVWLFA